MNTYPAVFTKQAVAACMKRTAKIGILDMRDNPPYVAACNAVHIGEPVATVLIFTRDTGHNSIGWWKNPDYERCWHLSLSFREMASGAHIERDRDLTRDWLNEFYGDSQKYLWCEPPYSAEGHRADTWHYRLFMQPDWKTPILPRGEVYSRDWTPAGWKSWSDVQADLALATEGAE